METINYLKKKDLFLFVLFVLLTFYIPFNDYGGARNQLIGLVLVGIATISSIYCNAMQIAFFLSYVAATAFPIYGINVHIITLLEIVFFFKVFSKHTIEKKHFLVILGLIIYSTFSIVLCQAPIGGLIKYIFNLLIVFAFLYLLTNEQKTNANNLIYFAYALGVLSSCIAGRYYVRPDSEEVFDITASWMRYCGLWTDPNFLGCFCLTAILALLKLNTDNTKKILVWIMCAVIFYFGMLTLSRTYIVITVLMLGLYLCRSLKGSYSSYFLTIMGAIVIVYGLSYSSRYLSENRIVSNDAIAGGRVDSSLALLEVQSTDVCAIFGAGCDNYDYLFSLLKQQNNGTLAAHNSYVDIVLQFGYVGSLIILLLFLYNMSSTKKIIKGVFQIYGLPMLCILLYLGTLSATKYEFVFFIVALFYSDYRLKKIGHRKQ